MTLRDAIVIGAGPAGSMAARALAEAGRDVLLLERGKFSGREKACGGMLAYRSFAEYGLATDVIETYMEREVFVFPWSRRVTVQPTVTVSRSAFDERLTAMATASGATLVSHCVVRSVTREPQGRIAVHALRNGTMETYTSRFVILADGVNSIAQRSLGLGYRKRAATLGTGLVLLFDVPGNQINEYYLFFGLPQLVGSWGYAWVFPNRHTLNAGLYLAPAMLRRDPNGGRIIEHHVAAGDTEFARLLRGGKVVQRIGAGIPLEVGRHLSGDGVLVAGDAAGLVFALTGGGIDMAMWSGRLAGITAAKALTAGDVSARFLATYENAVQQSPAVREMRRQSCLLRVCSVLGRCDPYLYAKLFMLYKLRSERSMLDNLKVTVFPMLGGIGEVDAS